jgi:glycosyltransferase involved in cell wall biosynthesis
VRIAQVAPLYEPVPPPLYGGTERVVSYLTESLVAQGHEVTLFASGDSVTAARLISACPRALRLAGEADAAARHQHLIAMVQERADEFDVVHFHCDIHELAAWDPRRAPSLLTLHGRLDLPGLEALFRRQRDLPLVSISDAQRAPLPGASWLATVHHGLPTTLHAPRTSPGTYLAFLGRISPEKRVDRAVAIARRAGRTLRIAAKIDEADAGYYASVRHLFDLPGIEFLGEVDERGKSQLLGGALALLFPIDWPEPFGLAMIESMACGTPVIAWPGGSVPELVDDGVTGFVVESLDAAAAAVERAAAMDRAACRRRFETRFSADRMARDYLECYTRLAGAGLASPASAGDAPGPPSPRAPR